MNSDETDYRKEGMRVLAAAGAQRTCMTKSMPTAMVVPSARPRPKSVAAKAGTLNGMMGWGLHFTALMSIFTELQPNEICGLESEPCTSEDEKDKGVGGGMARGCDKGGVTLTLTLSDSWVYMVIIKMKAAWMHPSGARSRKLVK